MSYFMVFDIGGSAVKWSVMDEKGNFCKNGRIDIASDVEGFFNSLSATVQTEEQDYYIEGIAISSPGAVDCKSGIVYGSSAIAYIHGPNFKDILSQKTGLTVSIENDANCAALGESWLGASKDVKDSAFIVCGTGIGGAVIKNKEIHSGGRKHGGEFGYCYLQADPATKTLNTWSYLGSTGNMALRIAARKGIDPKDFNGLKAFELYDQGDPVAIEEITNLYWYTAVGMYNIQYIYDPDVIVLGGAISERADIVEQIEGQMDLLLEANPLALVRPVIKTCKFGNDANKLGALYHYLQEQGGKQ